MTSTITSGYRTTVPKQVRDGLGLEAGDRLRWELGDREVTVSLVARGLLRPEKAIRVRSGETVEDVQRARRLRGLHRP